MIGRLFTELVRRLGIPVDVDPDQAEAHLLACRDALLGPVQPVEETR